MLVRYTLIGIILLITNTIQINAQNCPPAYVLNPVVGNNTIEWSKFPEFTLPFTIVYNATRFGDTQSQPLKHGFSHLATYSGSEPGSLPIKNRAFIWYGVATNVGDNQPWANSTLRSPWGNDTVVYRSYWDNFAAIIPASDLICLDIERMQREDRDILALKTNPLIPVAYRNLSDQNFLTTYKRDIRWWHAEAARRLKSKMQNPSAQITSYSDVPVRNTWLNITTNSWQDWTTNRARTHYLTNDDEGKVGGGYFDAMNIQAPSIYYYYGYDNPIGKDYLSYLLFHIEVNRAWSNKPVIPFVWLRIHDSYDPSTPFVSNFMAEATAIFPFFSGAKGLWLWENPGFPGGRQENYAPYEHFIYGLYRLSQFKDMFEGNYELVINQSARDHMELQNPLWRGVVNGNHILIAAQNPYAGDQEETSINVFYNKWYRTIKLKGKEVFLCKFDLNDIISSTEPILTDAYIAPNPVQRDMHIVLNGINGLTDVDFSLVNMMGQTILQRKLKSFGGTTNEYITLPSLSPGVYLARFLTDKNTITRKVVIAQ
jgi:hypothetical protein